MFNMFLVLYLHTPHSCTFTEDFRKFLPLRYENISKAVEWERISLYLEIRYNKKCNSLNIILFEQQALIVIKALYSLSHVNLPLNLNSYA